MNETCVHTTVNRRNRRDLKRNKENPRGLRRLENKKEEKRREEERREKKIARGEKNIRIEPGRNQERKRRKKRRPHPSFVSGSALELRLQPLDGAVFLCQPQLLRGQSFLAFESSFSLSSFSRNSSISRERSSRRRRSSALPLNLPTLGVM